MHIYYLHKNSLCFPTSKWVPGPLPSWRKWKYHLSWHCCNGRFPGTQPVDMGTAFTFTDIESVILMRIGHGYNQFNGMHFNYTSGQNV